MSRVSFNVNEKPSSRSVNSCITNDHLIMEDVLIQSVNFNGAIGSSKACTWLRLSSKTGVIERMITHWSNLIVTQPLLYQNPTANMNKSSPPAAAKFWTLKIQHKYLLKSDLWPAWLKACPWIDLKRPCAPLSKSTLIIPRSARLPYDASFSKVSWFHSNGVKFKNGSGFKLLNDLDWLSAKKDIRNNKI